MLLYKTQRLPGLVAQVLCLFSFRFLCSPHIRSILLLYFSMARLNLGGVFLLLLLELKAVSAITFLDTVSASATIPVVVPTVSKREESFLFTFSSGYP